VAHHIPRKRFGQHFLVDRGVIDAIVNAIAPARDDPMVEIGPGLGALTAPLLERLDRLHAVELDRDIVARLRRDWPQERLIIHEGDALKFDFGALLPLPSCGPLGYASPPQAGEGGARLEPSPACGGGQGGGAVGGGEARLRICGNLPYNISSPLLFHLADYALRIRDLHFMLQKEVVARMVAAPSTPDYGRLSVMLQRRFRMAWLFDVPPEAFDPPPKVDSAIVRMVPKRQDEMPPLDEAAFARVVAAAFAQRRKTLRNTLRGVVDEATFEALGIDPGLRAEALSLTDFEALARRMPTGGA
jgi:16S rRNA (adenine1518-N6/adenine1519-N6)-dimethyltransferase